MTKPKIAIVCDWLIDVGGAEKVIQVVHKMYPEAPIYTSQFRPETATWFRDTDVRTGWLNIFPASFRRLIPFLRQWYFSRLDLSDYDIVISITGAEAKGVKTGPNTLHISYMHAPTQYYWGLYSQYLEKPGFGVFDPIMRLGLKLFVGPMRKADYRAAQRPDIVVANSDYIQKDIKKYYDRDSAVIWPNVDVSMIQQLVSVEQAKASVRQGYIIYGRQVSWKRMDLAVEAAIKAKRHLTVVGFGPESDNLKKLAGGSEYITFLPRYNGLAEIVDRVSSSRAFIFPSLEPFGIAAVEALAVGTPVIGLGKGGALDIIEDGVNGLLFEDQTVDSLAEAFERFESMQFDVNAVRMSAEKFSEENFVKQLSELINSNYEARH